MGEKLNIWGKKGLFEVWDRCWRKGVSRLVLGVANTCEKEMAPFQPEVLWLPPGLVLALWLCWEPVLSSLPLLKPGSPCILLSGTMSSALKLIFLVPGQLGDDQSLNYLFLQLHLLTHGPVFSFLPVHHSTGPWDSRAGGFRAKQSAKMGFLRQIFPV